MGHTGPFRYWKRPRQKWVVFLAAVCQIICLWLNLREFQEIDRVSMLLFSEGERQRWIGQMTFECFLNGISGAIFVGIFLIGEFSKNRRMARLREGLLLLAVSLTSGAAGYLFRADQLIWCILISGVSLVVGIFSFLKKEGEDSKDEENETMP